MLIPSIFIILATVASAVDIPIPEQSTAAINLTSEISALESHFNITERINDTLVGSMIPWLPRTLSMSKTQKFLEAHNRARIHAGEAPFVWDRGLARYARRYASRRAGDCRMVHSNGPYGENLFWGMSRRWSPEEVVREWSHEHRFYDRNTNSCRPGKMCGHYTQIVWRGTSRVGCGHVECRNGGIFVICSYDPPGNYVGENPFGA